jgi:hypothetical protein
LSIPYIYVLTLTFHDAVEQIGETFKLRQDKAEDRLKWNGLDI